MDGIVTLILGFVLGVIVSVTIMFRISAWLLRNDKDFRNAMTYSGVTKETADDIEKFFYGDTKD